jgi:uncharacterized DUF497 family protein
MHFEFDAEKSKSNLTKHGIDFEQAQTLWRDADGLAVPSKYSGESRMLWIAAREGKLWTAIYTEREGKIRIISVRRAHENERNAYYEQQ